MNSRLVLALLLLAPVVAQPAPTAVLHVAGSRSASQLPGNPGAKLDAALAELSNNLDRVSAHNALSDLRSLSPATRFMQRSIDATPLVLVDAVTRGDAQQLK